MALKFGTSGVRGLVTEMTDCECYLYTKAFAQYLKTKTTADTISLAGDYRSSTPRIMTAAAIAIREERLTVDYCGTVSTPAVAYHAMQHGRASIMVTGSHIPDDRNGIKFNMPWGEVLKDDESEISQRYAKLKGADQGAPALTEQGELGPGISIDLGDAKPEAAAAYVDRYVKFFPDQCLSGLRVVLYQHSCVSRDILADILGQLGADVIAVGRSDSFVPVDTEAIENPEELAAWVQEHGVDALASADGDGDRPLLVDEQGKVVRGDVLGILVASFLEADSVSAPVSCNTALEKCGRFAGVSRTRIGSPYVIASMQEAVDRGCRTVVGYEANGGFLTATDITNPDTGETLKALPTRDAALPIIAALLLSVERGKPVSGLVAELPARFTCSGLQRDVPTEMGKGFVARIEQEGKSLAERYFEPAFGSVESLDFTDGARMTFADGNIVHLRPSGNAPEFRCYTESDTVAQAAENNETALKIIREALARS